jgi:hypothetical protein
MARRTFNNHSACPGCGVDADFTLDIGGKNRAPHMTFNGHTGPKGEKVLCARMIVLRGQDGWTQWAENTTREHRQKEGWE